MRQTQRPTNASVAASKSPSATNNNIDYSGGPAIINLMNDPIRGNSHRESNNNIKHNVMPFILQAFSPRNIHRKVNFAAKRNINYQKANAKTSPN